jgi:hypothetical protein
MQCGMAGSSAVLLRLNDHTVITHQDAGAGQELFQLVVEQAAVMREVIHHKLRVCMGGTLSQHSILNFDRLAYAAVSPPSSRIAVGAVDDDDIKHMSGMRRPAFLGMPTGIHAVEECLLIASNDVVERRLVRIMGRFKGHDISTVRQSDRLERFQNV